MLKNIRVIVSLVFNSLIFNTKEGSAAARASNLRVRRLRRYRSRFAWVLNEFFELDSTREVILISKGKVKKNKRVGKQRKTYYLAERRDLAGW